jgi:hypothetical protein
MELYPCMIVVESVKEVFKADEDDMHQKYRKKKCRGEELNLPDPLMHVNNTLNAGDLQDPPRRIS